MSITPLWMGGEDTSFPNGNTPTVSTTASHFRSGYARCTVVNSGTNVVKGTTFTAVTSCWLSARLYVGSWTYISTVYSAFGLGKSGTNSGLFIGCATSTGKIILCKRDAGVITQLAAEAGTSATVSTIHRLDLQVVNYGASATVNVYWDGVLIITYSGSVAASGVSDLDQVWFTGNTALALEGSEIFVTDNDPRACPGMVTGALTGAGTTNNWTNNTYTNINGTTISDANPAYSDTNAQVQGYNITNLPTGSFSIVGVKQEIRAAKSASPTVSKVQMGWYDGTSASGAGTGAAKSVTTAYATYEQLDTTNPITTAPWAQSEINALQIELTAQT